MPDAPAGGRPVVLCSQSPQRSALLQQLGIEPVVLVPDVDELESGAPAAVAAENARLKLAAAATAPPLAGGPDLAAVLATATHGAWVIACDTLLDVDGEVVGKPRDEASARAMLEALRGREHTVLGGLAVADVPPGGTLEDADISEVLDATQVSFRSFSDDVLAWYLGSGEWRGRAGAYAIQGRGAALVAGVDGDYANVVGLPVARLMAIMERATAAATPPR